MIPPEVELLIDELSERLVGQHPHLAAVELGRFVESIHEAMRDLFAFGANELVDQWHRHLATVGIEVHPSAYAPLHVIYGRRNMGGHNNADAHTLSQAQVDRGLAEVRDLLPRLCIDLESKGRDLVGQLRQRQQASLHQARATALEAAVVEAGCIEAALDAAEAFVATLEPRVRHGLEAAPPKFRLRRVLALLAKGAAADEGCALRRLAVGVTQRVGDGSLAAWLRDDAARLASLPRRERRLNVFRVEVFPDPEGEGWIIRSAEFLHPAHPAVCQALGSFPQHVPTREALASRVIQAFEAGAAELRARQLAGDASDFVLHLAVPAEHAADPWENMKARGPRPPVATSFLCLTVEPIEDDRVSAELREPVRPGEDVAVLWDPAPPEVYAARAGERRVLLVGPEAWAIRAEDRPALLWALDAKAAALVADHATALEALEALLPGGQPQPWVAVLRRVKELRLAHRSLKVFWTDRRYRPVPAFSL